MKLFKLTFPVRILTYVIALASITTGCSENDNNLIAPSQEPLQTDAEKLLSYFTSSNCQSLEDAINLSEQIMDMEYGSRSEEELINISATEISDEAYAVIEDYHNIVFLEDDGELEIRKKFLLVIDSHKDKLSKGEYDNLVNSVEVTMVAVSYYMDLAKDTNTRGSLYQSIKCLAGTAGSAGLGFLAGAGVGTVTLPLIGTVSGGAFGAFSGALVGLATFC